MQILIEQSIKICFYSTITQHSHELVILVGRYFCEVYLQTCFDMHDKRSILHIYHKQTTNLLKRCNKARDSTSLGTTYRSSCFSSFLYPFHMRGSNQLIRKTYIKVFWCSQINCPAQVQVLGLLSIIHIYMHDWNATH